MAKKKEPAAPKASGAALLNQLTKGATRKEPTAAQKDERPIWVIDGDAEPDYVDLVGLTTLIGSLNPTLEERQKEVKSKLFLKFTEEWFKQQRPPKNPRIVLRKKDDKGQSTTMDDLSFMFIVKYREQGLTKVVPNVEQLPADKTVEDVLVDMLTSNVVGLSEKNALALLKDDGEIKVVQKLVLCDSIDVMLESSDAVIKRAAEKMGVLMTGGSADGWTDEERQKCLQTIQIVTLKEGFFERACNYVSNAQQLRKLLEFVKATLQISSFEFAISDSPADRAKRLQATAMEFITDK